MSASKFSKQRSEFFHSYLSYHPEEGSTLGWHAGDGRLREHGKAALAAEERFYADSANWLASCDRDGLTEDEQLDHQVMTRVVEHHLHLGEGLWQGIDWSMYPCIMIQMQLVHASTSTDFELVTQRLGQLPRFFSEHQRNVERSFAGARPPDAMLAQYFADVQLPAAARYFREEMGKLVANCGVALSARLLDKLESASSVAADAYQAHGAWVSEKVLPNAVADYRLGEQEVSWRLAHTFGIEQSPSTLVAAAKQNLAQVQEAFIELARKLAPTVDGAPKHIGGMADARELAMAMQTARIKTPEAIVPLYRDYLDSAQQFAISHKLFEVPDDYAIGLVPIPAGLDQLGNAGMNWPAPLLDSNKLGHFAVATDPAAHSLAWAADLSVHEGFPGHHLQSLCWQRRFGQLDAPVRFLLVHDQVAVPRHYWGAMLNIEGYAVYAEELMRQHGFFTPAEELFVLLAHGIRAARVVVDLGLHCGELSPQQAAEYLMREVCLPESGANLEVRRYMQIPLQASSYLLGRLAIEALKQEVREAEGDTFSEASFHTRFFSYGPIDPATIRGCMLPTTPLR